MESLDRWGLNPAFMITIYYATSTGKTEDIAERLASLLGCPAELRDVDSLSSAQDFCQAKAMICCVPTWNTGADSFRSGTAWDSYVETIPDLTLTGKPAAILGLGDSSSYTFTASRSVIQGRFCGLPLAVTHPSSGVVSFDAHPQAAAGIQGFQKFQVLGRDRPGFIHAAIERQLGQALHAPVPLVGEGEDAPQLGFILGIGNTFHGRPLHWSHQSVDLSPVDVPEVHNRRCLC